MRTLSGIFMFYCLGSDKWLYGGSLNLCSGITANKMHGSERCLIEKLDISAVQQLKLSILSILKVSIRQGDLRYPLNKGENGMITLQRCM